MMNNINYDTATAKDIKGVVSDARKKFVGTTLIFGKI